MNTYAVTAITNVAMLALAGIYVWRTASRRPAPSADLAAGIRQLSEQIGALAVDVAGLSADVKAVRAELGRAAGDVHTMDTPEQVGATR